MGGKQLGFSDYEPTTAKKQTKREKFLSRSLLKNQSCAKIGQPPSPHARSPGEQRLFVLLRGAS